MRMIMQVKFPVEPFNTMVRDGSIGGVIQKILNETKPESVYFTEYEGTRGAIMVVDMETPSKVPVLAEPWFLMLEADVEFHIAMTPEDLAKGGLEELGKKWA